MYFFLEVNGAGHWVHHRHCSCHVEFIPCPTSALIPMQLASPALLLPPSGWDGLLPVDSHDYDRFLAICHSHLQHSHEPDGQRILVVVSWACAITNALIHTIALSTLNFCGPNLRSTTSVTSRSSSSSPAPAPSSTSCCNLAWVS